MLDRVMITCSIVELAFLGCAEGVTAFTAFQWAMLALIAAKIITIVVKALRR